MFEKWKSAIDNRKMFGALLIDLSKAFDCLYHDLLIAKLNPQGFSIAALRLVQNYLSNRKQRTKKTLISAVGKKSYLGYLRDQY